MKNVIRAFAVMLPVVLLTSGAASSAGVENELPGFFSGFWHGIIAPFVLFMGLFQETKMYVSPNAGWWYDLGFLMGIPLWNSVVTVARNRL